MPAWIKTPFGLFACCLLSAALWGCAGPAARVFPIAPISQEPLSDGQVRRLYDTDGDGAGDRGEVLGADGRIVALLDGEQSIPLNPKPASRELLIILDSVPYELVHDLWSAGRFRMFARPSRVISVFPAMTDPALAEFFGVSPCVGVESVHYDGSKLVTGYGSYLDGKNAPWLANVDWHLDVDDHAWAYLWPGPWYRYELGDIQRAFEREGEAPGGARRFSAYVVGTSALGSKRGREGHVEALVEVDRLCQQIMHESRGDVRITLMSDHGHNLILSRRVDLKQALRRCGYNAKNALRGPMDVIVPEFGLVSCAAIHTRDPAAVARDLVLIEGVELTCHNDGESLIVLNRDGQATISRGARGMRYAAQRGDPLQLTPILDALRDRGLIDADGGIDARALFEATVSHEYPDPLYRVWRAFHGLFTHTPDVLVSLADGWYAGSEELTRYLNMAAVHGNLNRLGSTGFVLSTSGSLPPAVRMDELRTALETAKR